MRVPCLWVLPFALYTASAHADALITTRVIKAGSILQQADVTIVDADIPGALSDPQAVTGKEAKQTIYPGRPILPDQLGPPTVVERNQIVGLAFIAGGLAITTEGRALARGGVGDVIRVLNLASRNTVQGQVMPDGTVRVSPPQG
jgi:flagellar basal body P-ring formation protein FlgA